MLPVLLYPLPTALNGSLSEERLISASFLRTSSLLDDDADCNEYCGVEHESFVAFLNVFGVESLGAVCRCACCALLLPDFQKNTGREAKV